MGKKGNLIVGQGRYDEQGNFLKEEATRMEVQPTPEIMNDMMEKGLWGSFAYLQNQEQENDLSR